MPTSQDETRDETERLRELHEDYAWQVNAAIGEGREDLIARLSDDYLRKAMQMMAGERLLTGEAVAPVDLGPRPRTARHRILSWARWWRRRR